VIPAFTGCPGSVGTAAHDDEHRGLGLEGLYCSTTGNTRFGHEDVDPGFEVFRDTEVVERHSKKKRVGLEYLIGECRGDSCRVALLVGAISVGDSPANDSLRSEGRGEWIDAYGTSCHFGVGLAFTPDTLHDVGDCSTARAFGANTGVKSKEGHGNSCVGGDSTLGDTSKNEVTYFAEVTGSLESMISSGSQVAQVTGESSEAHPTGGASSCDEALVRAFRFLGKRWSGVILGNLTRGPLGFAELGRRVEGIGDSVLAERLSDLQLTGLIFREVQVGPPVSVTYRLSPSGLALIPAMLELSTWASKNLPCPTDRSDATSTSSI